MAVSTKIIKTRLRSIGNTKKITKAMEMVAASKMRKTVDAVLATRPYAQIAWETVISLAKKVDRKLSPLLVNHHKRVGKSAIILITSNRGLCGGFNALAINYALKFASNLKTNIDWVVMGKVGGEFLARRQNMIAAKFDKLDVVTSASQILPLNRLIIDDFMAGKYDKVYMAYTDFISALVQKPRVKQLLPIDPHWDHNLGTAQGIANHMIEEDLSEDGLPPHQNEAGESPLVNSLTMEDDCLNAMDESQWCGGLFEPNAEEVLNKFLPRLIEIQLYQAVLESNASEHSARMMAMKNASDAASDMIDELTLAFNQARQAGITSEIAEISSGKAALE